MHLPAEGILPAGHRMSVPLLTSKDDIWKEREVVTCVRAWFGSDRPGCGACVCALCVRVLAVARESGCPGVVLGICPSQETQARSPGQRSSTDKKAISARLFPLSHFPLSRFSPVVPEGSVC